MMTGFYNDWRKVSLISHSIKGMRFDETVVEVVLKGREGEGQGINDFLYSISLAHAHR